MKRTRSRPSIRPVARSRLAEGGWFAERTAVGIHVLPEQGDLQDPLRDQRLDLSQHVLGTTVALASTQARHDAEGAGVVAADADTHPGAGGRFASRGQHTGEDLEGFVDLHLGFSVVAGALKQCRQASDVMGAEDHVDPRRPFHQRALVLLSQTPANRYLHAGMGVLDGPQVAEVAVEPVVGVFADRAGVEHDQVGRFASGRYVAGFLEQSGDALGVVDVHLTSLGTHLIRAWGCRPYAHGFEVTGPLPGATPGRGARRARQRAISLARVSRTTVTRI